MVSGSRPGRRGRLRPPPVFVALATLALLCAAARLPQTVAAADVVAGPYVTNVTDTSFVVSWVTRTPTNGYVRYGTESGQYPSRADDIRDASYVGYTHYVRIAGLLGANTKYYYSVVSGESTLDSPSVYYVTTGPTATAANELIFSGFVQKADGAEAPGALVYVYPQRQENSGIPSSMVWLATLAESDGYFAVNLGEARAATNAARTVGGAFGEVSDGDRVRFRVVGGIRVGGDLNQIEWQGREIAESHLDAGRIEVDVLSLPYAEQPTSSPTSSPSPTLSPSPSRTATPTPTAPPTASPVVAQPARTASPTPSVHPTEAPTMAQTPTPSPDDVEAAPESKPPIPSPAPPVPSPAGALAPSEPKPRASSPTARPTSVPTSTAPLATPTRPTLDAPEEVAPMPAALGALLAVGATLLASGLGLVTIGVVSNLRRRTA